MLKKQKVFKTEDNTILIVNIEYGDVASNPYWSITADEIEPITEEAGIAQVEDRLSDESEYQYMWKEAVHAGRTLDGFYEWFTAVGDEELSDWQDTLDCSLYPDSHTIDGVEYWYLSRSCGCMHDEILKYFPEAQAFVDAHIKDHQENGETRHKFNKLVADDVEAQVIKFTREIVAAQ